MEIIIKVKIEDNAVISTEVIKASEVFVIPSQYSEYFDSNSKYWTKDPAFNKLFLVSQREYANDLLRNRGHIFLNEVYDMLGLPRTEAGAIVGWIYEENNPVGDNYIDFGLADGCNEGFMNGYRNEALLDFNVDGAIFDRIHTK